MPVDSRTWQPYGLLHGGASVALSRNPGQHGRQYVRRHHASTCAWARKSTPTMCARRAAATVTGTARPVHQGGRTQVWGIDIVNEPQEVMVCISRLTMAVIKRSPPLPGHKHLPQERRHPPRWVCPPLRPRHHRRAAYRPT
jgi:1,4-dihydroxy-2-naphthoyl-CoA hydrolase